MSRGSGTTPEYAVGFSAKLLQVASGSTSAVAQDKQMKTYCENALFQRKRENSMRCFALSSSLQYLTTVL